MFDFHDPRTALQDSCVETITDTILLARTGDSPTL